MRGLRYLPLVCAIACAAAFPAGAFASATHGRSRTFRVTEPPAHDLNICGFPGTFNMVISGEWNSTETSAGYHFQLSEVSRWTVTFDDPALGIWSGRGTETISFTASPGDVVTFHDIFNGSEGPVRIHEHQTFVVAPDGTLRVDINQVTTDYTACPS
jgi:hypothetical protein